MIVYYTVSLGRERAFGEYDLSALTDSQSLELAQKEAFKGTLVLAHEGSPYVNIEDELEPWVQNLCFAAVPKILAGESHKVIYFTRPGFVLLEPEGESVLLSGDPVPAARFPARELAAALFDCGERFVGWAREIKESDASYQANLDCVVEPRAPALAALRGAGLAPTDAA